MGLNLKSKIKMFWERNKTAILEIGVFALYVSAVGGGCAYIAKKQHDKTEREWNEKQEQWKKEYDALIVEQKAENERKKNDPECQFPNGGWVVNDFMYEPDIPGLDVNDVPLESLGEFGQEFKRRYKAEYPNWKEIGMMNPDKLLVSIDIAAEHVYPDEEEEVA